MLPEGPETAESAPVPTFESPVPASAVGKAATASATARVPARLTPEFAEALRTQRFSIATDLYFQATEAAPEQLPELRQELDRYVEACLRACQPEQFMHLAESWLDTFYADIPMLVTLARFQSRQAQPEAAANTLLVAKTYALQGGEQRLVQRAIAQLAADTDSSLSRGQRWIELLGFYEFLSALGLGNRETRLRQAQLHAAMGEQGRAERIVQSLLAGDSGTDPEWTARLQAQLAPAGVRETIPAVTSADALPLDRHRDHYRVAVELNDTSDLSLVIDTGASVTTVSSERFRALPRQDFELLGSRIFNTAGGYIRGDVYRARSLRIGPHRLENPVIAVLPQRLEEDADGLLGMNALRNFRFEIDQDRALLHLEPR